jgi:hypothetical protein
VCWAWASSSPNYYANGGTFQLVIALTGAWDLRVFALELKEVGGVPHRHEAHCPSILHTHQSDFPRQCALQAPRMLGLCRRRGRLRSVCRAGLCGERPVIVPCCWRPYRQPATGRSDARAAGVPVPR